MLALTRFPSLLQNRGRLPGPIVSISLRLAIPWRVALQQPAYAAVLVARFRRVIPVADLILEGRLECQLENTRGRGVEYLSKRLIGLIPI